jgi:acyl-CoA hydrolase
VGLVSDAMAGMLDRRATGVAVELLGGAQLFEACAGNPAVTMASSARVHDPQWLATLPRLVSICSALSVDLAGQVASESVGGRPLAGIGGSADFFEGAHLSPGGVRIVALPATGPGGTSRIVGRLGGDTPVTLPRHSVDVVVTEYGAAPLSGRTEGERAEALLRITAPDQRREVAAASEETRRRR